MPAHQETITIERLVHGGDGLGRLATGEVAFVSRTAPGDTVQAMLTGGGKKPYHGVLKEMVTAAPERIEPRCEHFKQGCGGCQWQFLPVEKQREWKETIVVESLRRLGKIENPPMRPMLAAEGETASWHYRNKVEWLVFRTAHGPDLGFSKAQTHDVLPIETCWIIPPRFNEVAAFLRKTPQLLAGVDRIRLRENSQGQWLLVPISDSEGALEAWEEYADQLHTDFPEIATIVYEGPRKPEVISGDGLLEETVLGKRFRLSSDSFFQVNTVMATKMLEILGNWMPPGSPAIWDLYGGIGFFAIGLSDKAHRLVLVENHPGAVRDAAENAKLNGIDDMDIYEGDVRDIVRGREEKIDVAIVDPPRVGCHPDVILWLSANVTQTFIYVSCDPATLARDARRLLDAGWQLEEVQPLDLFPQTYHVESMARFTKLPNA